MDKDILEQVLKNINNDNAICKILSVESSPAVEKFRNFLSTVNRLKMRVVLGNGRVATKYLIAKESKLDAMVMCMQFITLNDPFQTEIMMYETVLKEMEYLMDEFEDTDNVLWCHLVHYVRYKTILLEDLQAKGFLLPGKAFLYDLDHGLMTVYALAKFHGLSKVLEERGIVRKDNFKPWFGFNNDQLVQMGFMSFKGTLNGIKQHWEPHWASTLDKITITPEMLQNKLKEMGQIELSFNVVCHGDCNKNNILFKYGWNKRPIAVKLIDYQLSFYGSPCCDLNNILYCCVHPNVRRANFDLLMKTYHEALCGILDRYRYTGSRPSLEELMEGMETYSFLGYWIFLSFYPTMSLGDDMEKYIDLEKVMQTGGQEGCCLDFFKNESLKDELGPDLELFAEKYF